MNYILEVYTANKSIHIVMLGVVVGQVLEPLPLSYCRPNSIRTILKTLRACFKQVQACARVTTISFKKIVTKHCFAMECVSRVLLRNYTPTVEKTRKLESG